MNHILWIPSWYPQKETPHCGIYFKEQIRALQKRGLKVGVIAPEMRSLRQLSLSLVKDNYFQTSMVNDNDLNTYRLHGWNLSPFYEKGQMKTWCFFAMKLMESYVRNHGLPNLIHAHSGYWAGIAARAISLKYHIPYCLTEHRTDILKLKCLKKPAEHCWSLPYMKEAYNNASKLIAVSRPLKEAMSTYMDRPKDFIEVIPNSVDPRFFFVDLNMDANGYFTFLNIANLIPVKNISLLLSAFQRTHRNNPKTRLIIAGDGIERNRLLQRRDALGLKGAVEFLGNIDRDAIKNAYEQADAFVLSSNYESFSVVCAEAMASGLPVIATRCGGPEDIIQDGLGLLIPPKDEDSLAEAMISIQSARHHFPPKILRAHALKHYGPDSIAAQQHAIYQRILNV